MRPESERAKRYAQCHFVDMGALKRFMLGQVRCVFYNMAKTTSSGVNIKQSNTLEICDKIDCIGILITLASRNFYNMLMSYQKHS